MSDDLDFSDVTTRVLERARQRANEWRAWVAEAAKPARVTCERHGYERELSIDASMKHWPERVAEYEACPQCAEEDVVRRRSDDLRAAGVLDENVLHATFDNYQARTDVDRSNVASCREFAAKGRGFLVMLGPVGTGKSHLAVAVMRAREDARRMMFVTQSRLLRKLRDTYRSDAAEDPVKRYAGASLLVLDEVGLSAGGRDELPMLHEILSARHGSRSKPTVMTSNLPRDEFMAAIGERMADRIRQSGAALLFFSGESMRPRFRKEYLE